MWTASRVATLIGRKFHVSYSVSGATRLMHPLGFSPQVPARRVAERDEQAVTAWKVATWAEVKESGRPAGATSVSRTKPPGVRESQSPDPRRRRTAVPRAGVMRRLTRGPSGAANSQ
ncbi:winged helix-turn-helix domain-containing protein [Streptomyces sp. NBC_00868]|uniref:helix-turn-helix domain-containing protein n=1 Tax=Streptomyces sp. NBC_00048 TaxID=2975628 RepID=UPI003252C54B|nr:winged helix-turn-helix domain-containing protein [Streptomyces sp. NBC_00868]